MSGATTATDTIREAVLILVGRCDHARTKDGAGFNRYDAPAGHDLARKLEAGQDVNPVFALKLVSKYRGQLAAAGITLPTLDVIREAQEARRAVERAAEPPAVRNGGVAIERVGTGTLRLRFRYDPVLVEAARNLPGRRFDVVTKTWLAPASALDAVLAAFPDAALAGDLAAQIEAKRAADEATERARAAQIEIDLAAYESIRESCSLYAHQDVGVRWLIEHRSGIVADDLGIGKTRQALVAARALGYRIIVIAPAGLRINWLREAEMVGAQIEIYSWAKVPEPIEGDYTLIADEAHYAQNLAAARTKRFLALAKAARAVFPLTGTPIKNGRPVNLFPLLLAIDHPLSRDKKYYEVRFCAAHASRWTQWDVTGAAHLDELHRRIADAVLRRLKEECLDLPEKVRVIRQVELSDAARATYDARMAELRAEYRRRKAAGEIKDGGDALVLLGHAFHAGSIAKVEAAVELAEEVLEQGGQVVLYAKYLDSAGQIAETLGAGRITGEENAQQRQDAIDRFQRGELRAIVATLGAGNVGITLTAAQTVILVDRPWTPGDAIQAEDRLHRIGQTGSVLAVWLEANGADRALDALLLQKWERSELILAGKRKTLSGLGTIADVAEAVLG